MSVNTNQWDLVIKGINPAQSSSEVYFSLLSYLFAGKVSTEGTMDDSHIGGNIFRYSNVFILVDANGQNAHHLHIGAGSFGFFETVKFKGYVRNTESADVKDDMKVLAEYIFHDITFKHFKHHQESFKKYLSQESVRLMNDCAYSMGDDSDKFSDMISNMSDNFTPSDAFPTDSSAGVFFIGFMYKRAELRHTQYFAGEAEGQYACEYCVANQDQKR